MTYRLIKLLDCPHLEACTCFIGVDTGLRSFIMLNAADAPHLFAPSSSNTTSKAEFLKLTLYWQLLLIPVCNTKFYPDMTAS